MGFNRIYISKPTSAFLPLPTYHSDSFLLRGCTVHYFLKESVILREKASKNISTIRATHLQLASVQGSFTDKPPDLAQY